MAKKPTKPISETQRLLAGTDRRAHQRAWLTEWTLDRIAKTKEMPSFREQVKAIRGEFGKGTYSLTAVQAGKRVTAVRRVLGWVLQDQGDRIRAELGGFLDELRESNLEPRCTNVKTDSSGRIIWKRYEIENGEARRCTEALIKLFGVAEPEKVEHEVGIKDRDALIDRYVERIVAGEDLPGREVDKVPSD